MITVTLFLNELVPVCHLVFGPNILPPTIKKICVPSILLSHATKVEIRILPKFRKYNIANFKYSWLVLMQTNQTTFKNPCSDFERGREIYKKT